VNTIEVDRVSHAYGDRRALDDVSFGVARGEIFGLLGPNGGGKTTLFRILSTLMRPTAGRARIQGHDTVAAAPAVRRALGVVFQSPSLDRKLTVRENLLYQGALYGFRRSEVRARAARLLEAVGLADRVGDRVEDLSGGMKRRVELAKGLLHGPQVLLMDEPSTGLDPGGRRDLWVYLDRVRQEQGVTGLVATHLMEEAERCDRLAILDRGRIVATGAPAELKGAIGGDVITLEADDADALAAAVSERFGVAAQPFEGRVRFEHAEGHRLIPRLVEAFPERIRSVSLGRPTLEDVFIRQTGHRFWSGDA